LLLLVLFLSLLNYIGGIVPTLDYAEMKTKQNMTFNKQILFALSIALMAMVSCSTVKDIAYFQNKVVNEPEAIDKHAGIVIQPKDMLSIVVSSRNPELVAMFNLPVISYQAGSEVVAGAGQQRLLGYVVDNDGYIDFPVLGSIKVAGLTRWELSELIKNKLLNDGLLTDAVVTVEFMNFKVSVIGEVNAPGTYSLQNDKVTILQAISLARDLTIFGQRENVCVIREREGERVIYEINLCDVSMFNSPAYYLQQNDVVYVQPSEVKARQSTTDDKALRMTSIFVSGGSLLVSVAALIVNLIR
jgi:polysaccharide export outer membrane protein